MSIRTQDDWWKLAEKTIPDLPDYAFENGCYFDIDYVKAALKDRNWYILGRMFEKLWAELPDSSSIRYGAFSPLCDLCSEVWVFHEDLDGNPVDTLTDGIEA